MNSTTFTIQQALRSKYTDGGLETASAAKVVQLCFERLDRDIDAAVAAMGRFDYSEVNDSLCHAQDIVHELLLMLDLDQWEHAHSLASIYRYVLDLLMKSNVKKHPAPAIEARVLLAELGEGFRGAAASVASATATSASGTSNGERRLESREMVSQFSVRA